MDPTNRYLESCQNPSQLQPTELDEVTDEVFFYTERAANSSGSDQTIEGFPITSTPTKKDGAKQDPQEKNDAAGRVAYDEPGAVGGTLDERCYPKDVTPAQPHPAPPSPEQICPVPEPIAEISSVTSDMDLSGLRNPDIRPRPAPDILGAELLGSLDGDSILSSIQKNSEELKRFTEGYKRQSVRGNLRHSKSLDGIKSLTDSMTSQQEEIHEMRWKLQSLWDDMSQSKARLESLERRHQEVRLHTHQITSISQFVPYDCLTKQGKTSFIIPTADLNLQAELFLNGFGSGEGTHISLRLKAVIGVQNAVVQLPPRCHFEARVVNVDDDEETRKKSSNSEAVAGSHTVEFPKMIEKDVVENETLGYKKNGFVNITLIISWDEV